MQCFSHLPWVLFVGACSIILAQGQSVISGGLKKANRLSTTTPMALVDQTDCKNVNNCPSTKCPNGIDVVSWCVMWPPGVTMDKRKPACKYCHKTDDSTNTIDSKREDTTANFCRFDEPQCEEEGAAWYEPEGFPGGIAGFASVPLALVLFCLCCAGIALKTRCFTKHTKHARESHSREDSMVVEKDESHFGDEMVLEVKNADIDAECGDTGDGHHGILGQRMSLNRSQSSLGIGDQPRQPLGTSPQEIAAALRIQKIYRGHESRKHIKDEEKRKAKAAKRASKDFSAAPDPFECGDIPEGYHGELGSKIKLNRSMSVLGVQTRVEKGAKVTGARISMGDGTFVEGSAEVAAAICIQAAVRGNKSRKSAQEEKKKPHTATETVMNFFSSEGSRNMFSSEGSVGRAVASGKRAVSAAATKASAAARQLSPKRGRSHSAHGDSPANGSEPDTDQSKEPKYGSEPRAIYGSEGSVASRSVAAGKRVVSAVAGKASSVAKEVRKRSRSRERSAPSGSKPDTTIERQTSGGEKPNVFSSEGSTTSIGRAVAASKRAASAAASKASAVAGGLRGRSRSRDPDPDRKHSKSAKERGKSSRHSANQAKTHQEIKEEHESQRKSQQEIIKAASERPTLQSLASTASFV